MYGELFCPRKAIKGAYSPKTKKQIIGYEFIQERGPKEGFVLKLEGSYKSLVIVKKICGSGVNFLRMLELEGWG